MAEAPVKAELRAPAMLNPGFVLTGGVRQEEARKNSEQQ